MRANQSFSYVIDRIPEPQPVFSFIQEHSSNLDDEMYGNFNMGAGFALFVPEQQAPLVQQIAQSNGLAALHAGVVEHGPKQVVIRPKSIVFASETLQVR